MRRKIPTEERAANATATSTITDEERALVLQLVNERGMQAATEALRLDRSTITRLLSPLPIRRQTALWLRTHLAQLRV